MMCNEDPERASCIRIEAVVLSPPSMNRAKHEAAKFKVPKYSGVRTKGLGSGDWGRE